MNTKTCEVIRRSLAKMERLSSGSNPSAPWASSSSIGSAPVGWLRGLSSNQRGYSVLFTLSPVQSPAVLYHLPRHGLSPSSLFYLSSTFVPYCLGTHSH